MIITRPAYAKINLSLEVIGRRDDGYHDIITVMQMVDLHDTLTFTPAEDLTLESDSPELTATGEVNIALKAANALRDATGTKSGAHIQLEKRIPLTAGLGGGSSDAAATLRGLNELWGLKLSNSELSEIGSYVGSDVPFLLGGPTALVEGRGERVTPVPSPPPCWVVLVYGRYDVANKTQHLYSNLHKKDMSDGNTTRQLLASLLDGSFPRSNLLANTFERAAYNVFQGLDSVRRQLLVAGGREVHLSGSGPTLFTLFPPTHESKARTLHQTLQSQGLQSYLTRTLTRRQ